MTFDRRNLAARRALAVLMAVCGLLAAPRVRAGQTDDAIDDPKMARRLGSRVDWTSPPAPASPPSPGTPPNATPPTATPPAGTLPTATLPTAAPTAGTPPTATLPTAPAPAGTPLTATLPTATLPAGTPPTATLPTAPPPGESSFEPVLPRVQLAFRRFDFVQIGASNSAGLAASEAFDTLSLDVYPVSSVVRFGLSTAYGWQAGMTSDGDYFATETASLGPQLNLGRVVPFAEGLAGVGYMRRFQFDHSIPTVYWQLGIDLGASVYFARIGFVSLAVGYLRPVNGFLKTTTFESIYTNTWSFKIGIGI